MSPDELSWIWEQLKAKAKGLFYVDRYRAARVWKSTDMRRFRRIEAMGCCGSGKFIVKRWNESKGRDDIFLLGFNFGH